MRSFGVRLLVFLLVICLAFPIVAVKATENAVSLSVTCIDNATSGGEVVIKIAVSKPEVALAGLEFVLNYDPEFVSPILTANSEENREMDALVKAIPEGWEQMSYHSSLENTYHFRFAKEEGASPLETASGLVLEIPFKVEMAGTFVFTIDSKDVIAIEDDDSYTVHSGKGGEITVFASSGDEKVAVEFNSRDIAYKGIQYNLNIKATNLSESDGIIGIEFDLQYDKSIFKPIITSNKEGEMDDFIINAPKDSWEQMCSFSESNGKYTLRFAANTAESIKDSEIIEVGKALEISIPFEVIGDEGSVASFTITSASIIAVNNSSTVINGAGDIKSVSIEAGDSNNIPEDLGYEIKNGCLIGVPEKTAIGDFLSDLGSLYITDQNGSEVTDGYVSTGFKLTDGSTIALQISVTGDADGNGKVDTADYFLVKRIYYNTYTPTVAQLYSVALSNGETVTTNDYFLIKRHYFGTYNLNSQAK